jgi:hypothetical protein
LLKWPHVENGAIYQYILENGFSTGSEKAVFALLRLAEE